MTIAKGQAIFNKLADLHIPTIALISGFFELSIMFIAKDLVLRRPTLFHTDINWHLNKFCLY